MFKYCPQLGNHDHGEDASGLGGDLVDCLNMILLMLPGTAVTYHGEEFGMENARVPWDAEEATAKHENSQQTSGRHNDSTFWVQAEGLNELQGQ
jgi:glycosidase